PTRRRPSIVSPAPVRGSKPPSRMDRGDPAGEVAEADVVEPGLPHPLGEGFLRREAPDALDEILVGGAVAGHDLPDERQRLEGIEVVEPGEPGQGDAAELEAEEPPARAQDASGLGERRVD